MVGDESKFTVIVTQFDLIVPSGACRISLLGRLFKL